MTNGGKVQNGDSVPWLCEELQGTSSPGQKLGSFVKALLPGGAPGGTYSNFVVEDLPEGANAGGFRPGACDELASSIAAEFAVAATGHEMKGTSAFYEYLSPSGAGRALLMKGARVLAGWPAGKWGELGMGPTHASMSAIIEGTGISWELMQKFVDIVLNLDSASLKMYRQGGSMRQMALAGVASLIMYYPECMAKEKMPRVQAKLREAWSCVFARGVGASSSSSSLAAPILSPDGALRHWSVLVRDRFNADNLSITAQVDREDLVQLSDTVATLQRTVVQTNVAVHQLQGEFTRQFAQLEALLLAKPASSIPTSASSSISPAQLPAENMPANTAASTFQRLSTLAAASSSSSSSGAESNTKAKNTAAWGPLVSSANVAPAKLAGVPAMDVYENFKRGTLPTYSDQDKKRVKFVVEFFDAFATDEERLCLKTKPQLEEEAADEEPDEPLSSGSRKRLLLHLQNLVVARLAAAYDEAGENIPKGLQNKPVIAAGVIESRQAELRKLQRDRVKEGSNINHCFEVQVNRGSFAAFRAKYESESNRAVGPKAKKARK